MDRALGVVQAQGSVDPSAAAALSGGMDSRGFVEVAPGAFRLLTGGAASAAASSAPTTSPDDAASAGGSEKKRRRGRVALFK